jgi:hypothetical protein
MFFSHFFCRMPGDVDVEKRVERSKNFSPYAEVTRARASRSQTPPHGWSDAELADVSDVSDDGEPFANPTEYAAGSFWAEDAGVADDDDGGSRASLSRDFSEPAEYSAAADFWPSHVAATDDGGGRSCPSPDFALEDSVAGVNLCRFLVPSSSTANNAPPCLGYFCKLVC